MGGDAVLQARDAGEAAGAAAAKLGMGPFIQAAFAGSQAASAASIKQKQPLSRAEQLDEASKAAMLVADRCGMTSQEKEMIAEATVAAKDAAHLDNESDIAMCFAVALASRLSLTDEARIAVTGACTKSSRGCFGVEMAQYERLSGSTTWQSAAKYKKDMRSRRPSFPEVPQVSTMTTALRRAPSLGYSQL